MVQNNVLRYQKRVFNVSLKEEENLKTKASCVRIQYLQNVQRILSQLTQNEVFV